jgi:hypothetical protein
MDDAFERKLRAAVSAGWRVLVVEVGLLTLAWAALWASTLRKLDARISGTRIDSDRTTAETPGSRAIPAQS